MRCFVSQTRDWASDRTCIDESFSLFPPLAALLPLLTIQQVSKYCFSPSFLKATHTHTREKKTTTWKTHSGGWAGFLLSLTGPHRIRILLWASRGGSSPCCCTHQHLQLAVRERKRRGRPRPTIPPFINRCCASRDPLDIHQSSGNDHWSGPTIEI